MTRRRAGRRPSRAPDRHPAAVAPTRAGSASPAPWLVEFRRSPLLTILTVFGVVMIALVIATILPDYFLIPAAALVAVVAATEVRPILSERRLARVGEVVPGVVTGLVPMKRIRKHNYEATWTVEYRYAWGSVQHEGRSRALPFGVIDGLAVGDAIVIHVDPSSPEVSAWIAGA